MRRLLYLIVAALLLTPVAGRGDEPAKDAATPAKASADKSHSKMLRMFGGGEGKDSVAVSGKAVEVLNGGGYTFVNVEKDGRKQWVAIPDTKVAVGDQVSFAPGNEMQGFESKSLNRKFETIVFSSGPAAAKAPAPAPATNIAVSGKVVEVLNGGGYTYVCVEKDNEKTWVAVPETEVKVGTKTAFAPGMEMVDFPSKALNRTFPRIIFSGGLLTPAGGKKAAKAPSGGNASAAGTDEKVKVEKATGPNAYTVAELFALKGKLAKQKVSIRGKVVRVAAGIMKRNWIHLQDGTGSKKKKTNDLVVTSDALPEVGDIVTVTGKLAKDKDFGGGYKYAVIVEQAELAE